MPSLRLKQHLDFCLCQADYRKIWNVGTPPAELKNQLQPYLLSCDLPSSHLNSTPISVSLVEEHCETPTNFLNIIFDPPAEKKEFAVCVKGMGFPTEDLSARMVEWIEVLRALGADKIFLYNYEVHPNVTKVSVRGLIQTRL